MKNILLAALILLFACQVVNAQSSQKTFTIKGRITGAADTLPVANASVVIKGTKTGTLTDADGRFSIDASKGQTLVFSDVSYISKEVVIDNDDPLNISLLSIQESLNDVVVVGYGTQTRKDLTGAVSTVDVTKTFRDRPLNNPTKALQGVVPGLAITYGNGGLTDAPNITLRGIGSVNGSSAPLILVDNVPTPDLTYINPSDIESISVLKDAASASIYGSRAAFGVILIKTKQGQFNAKNTVNYYNNFSWNTPTNLPAFADPVKDLTGVIAGAARAGNNSPELFGMDLKKELTGIKNWEEKYAHNRTGNEMIPGEDFDLPSGNDPAYFYRVWNVKDIMLKKWTPQQNHVLQFAGGSDKIAYYLSGGYYDEGGIMKVNPDNLKKYNITAGITAKINEWFSVNAKLMYRNFEYDYPYAYQQYFYYMWRWGAWFPWGTYQGKYFREPIAYLAQANTCTTTDNYTRADITAILKPVKHVTIQASYTIGKDNVVGHTAGGPVSAWDFWVTAMPYHVVTSSSSNVAGYSASRNNVNSFNTFATYENTFAGKHHLTAMMGMNADDNELIGFNAAALGELDPNYPEIGLSIGQQSAGSSHYKNSYAGFFGRINYDYKGKYLIELNERRDGSSVYSPLDRWAFFSSGSIGYRISEEKFMQSLKPVLSNLKFRASLGSIGNQDLGGQYYIPTMSNYAANWIVNNVLVPTFTNPLAVANSLKWESIKSLDFGVDASFLDDQLSASFDWYQRNNDGMVDVATVPATFGAAAPHTNQGNMRERGFELTISGHKNINKNLLLYATLDLSNSNGVITKWKNDSKSIGDYYAGEQYGAIWGFETAGFFKDNNDVQNSPSQKLLESGNFTYGPGDIKFKDLNHDGEIDGGKASATDHGDLTMIGNTQPRYLYSARVGAEWKGFDIDVFIQGVGKRNLWGLGDVIIPMYSSPQILYANQIDYWTPDHQNARYPNPYAGNSGGNISGLASGSHNFYPQTKYLLNLAYCRLKNVSIGYSLPGSLINKWHITKLRVYLSGENLFTVSHVGAPIDPEITDGDLGYTGRTYPFQKNYSFGIQLTL